MQHLAFKAATWMAVKSKDSNAIPENVVPADLVPGTVEAMDRYGWLNAIEQTLSGGEPATLRESEAGRLRSQRNIKTYRSHEAQLRVLEYLEGHPYASSVQEMEDDEGALDDFTGPLTSKDLTKADVNLVEFGMIKGTGSFGVEYSLRPEITTKGERCLEKGVAPANFETSGSVSNIDNSNNFQGDITGGVQIGDYNTMNVDLSTGDRGEALAAVQELRQLLKEHAPDQVETADAIETMVRAEKPNGTVIQAMIGSLAQGLSQSVGGEMGQRIVAIGEQVLTALGA